MPNQKALYPAIIFARVLISRPLQNDFGLASAHTARDASPEKAVNIYEQFNFGVQFDRTEALFCGCT